MSVSVAVKPFSNQTYGSISASDSTQSSLHSSNVSSPWCTNLNVCSGKKESFTSTWCTPFKLCITLFSLLSLILLSLFVSGVMYVNAKDGISISTSTSTGVRGGFNNKLISHSQNGIINNIDLDECQDSDYMWEYTFWSPNNDEKYEFRYWCYESEEDCLECFEEFEENDACYEEEDDSHTGCHGNCTISAEAETRYGETLYCFHTVEDESCFSWDSIVTKVIGINDNNEHTLITQDVMINDIKLGDYVITGINGQYSKVIDMSHYSIYDKSTETAPMIEICFDTDLIHGNDGDLEESVLYNCIKMTERHLIYVNGIDLDSLNTAQNIKIGDYLYHSGLKQFVVVNKINRGINDYFRNIITEDGNIIINNGFFASTIAQSKSSNNGNVKEIHINRVNMYNIFYKIFTLNGNYEDLWESDWFNHILRIPTKNAISHWTGYGSQISKKYPYPLKSMIFGQCIGCFLLYLFGKGMINLFSQTTKSVSY